MARPSEQYRPEAFRRLERELRLKEGLSKLKLCGPVAKQAGVNLEDVPLSFLGQGGIQRRAARVHYAEFYTEI